MGRLRLTIGLRGAAAAGVLFASLALPATPASAGTPPSVKTVLATRGVVEGTVNPHLEATEYWVDYGPASQEWCTSGGTKGSHEQTAHTTDEYEGNKARYASVKPVGLVLAETYCFALVAKNASGEASGVQLSYTEGAPAVEFKEETLREEIDIRPRSATSEGLIVEVEDEGGAPDSVEVRYDVEYALASSKWCTSGGVEGSAEHTSEEWRYDFFQGEEYIFGHHEFVISGLTSKSQYCARPEAIAEGLVNHGLFASFSAGAPKVSSYGAYQTGPTTVVVPANINPAAQPAEYQVLYAKSSEEWCTSGGVKGSATSTTLEELTSGKPAEVHVEIAGLTNGERYCAELVVTNASGAASVAVGFQPGAPEAFVEDVPDEEETVQPNGEAHYYVNATVFKHERPAEEWAEYALASTRWCRTDTESGETAASTIHTVVGSELTGEGEAVFGPVQLPLLPPGTNYCGKLHVKNEKAETTGFFTFTTAAAFTFTVKIEGTGSGTVTGKRISCPGVCTAVYLVEGEGKPIHLEARAAEGSTFAGWTPFSCLFGLENATCEAGNSTATAIFNKNGSSGGGGGSQTGSQAGDNSGGGPGGPQGEALACTISRRGLGTVKRPPRAKHRHGKHKSKPATLPVSVNCNGAASLTISGTLTQTVGKGKHKTTTHMKLAPAHGAVAAGVTGRLAPSLPAKALSALAHGARIAARLSLSAEGPAGSAHEVILVTRLKLH